jgi:hypothetical protein
MERPEYGYATYFFELVQNFPVKWQVQRLITVMSVATTGRAALLENRQLEVDRSIQLRMMFCSLTLKKPKDSHESSCQCSNAS